MASALLLAAPACGKRGEPLPPLPRTPQPVTELRLAQRGAMLELSYVAPRLTAGGARLGVLEVELMRADAPGDFPKVARRTRRRVAPGETLVETEPLPPPGSVMRVRAQARVGGEISPPSPVVSLTVQPPPSPPTSFVAQLEPQAVVLAWVPPPSPPPTPPPSPSPSPSPSATPSAGLGASPRPSPSPSPSPKLQGGFWVYRREPESAYRRPLTPAPVAGSPFRDATIAAGERWCYVVRTVASSDPVVESASSGEACVENKDVFPPAPPTGLAVLPREDGLEVSWSPSLESDLAAYRVYRTEGGGPRTRVGEVAAPETSFRDSAAPHGAALAYAVTAVDRDGNESAPSAPVEARRP